MTVRKWWCRPPRDDPRAPSTPGVITVCLQERLRPGGWMVRAATRKGVSTTRRGPAQRDPLDHFDEVSTTVPALVDVTSSGKPGGRGRMMPGMGELVDRSCPGPGMPGWGARPIPARLACHGDADMVRIPDVVRPYGA